MATENTTLLSHWPMHSAHKIRQMISAGNTPSAEMTCSASSAESESEKPFLLPVTRY